MKTPDLMAALAADRTRQIPVSRLLLAALAAGLLVSIAIYVAAIGPRSGFLDVLSTPRVLFKLGWSAVLACAAVGLALRLASPGRRAGAAFLAVAGAIVLLVVAVAIELLVVPPDLWKVRTIGTNATWCLRLIPVLSLAPLAAALWVLRRAAPTHPALAGAAAGLLAGALGAVLYATHCPDDSPLFVASWYGLAILGMTLLGSGLGARLLRW